MRPSISKENLKKNGAGTVNSRRFMLVMDLLLQMNFFYCLLLLGYFVMYQMDRGPFAPWLYLGAMLCFLPLYWISRKLRLLWQILLADFAVLLLSALFYPITNDRWYLLLVEAVFVAVDLITRGDPADVERGVVWSVNHSVYWGAGIWILMAASVFAGAQNRFRMDTGCTKLMLFVFCIYIAEDLIQKYFYLIYDHFQKLRKIDQMDRGQVGRILSFGAVCAAACSLAVYLLSKVAARIISWIFSLANRLWQALWGNITGEPAPVSTPEPIQETYHSIKGNGREFLKHLRQNPMIARIANVLVFLLLVGIILLALYYIYRFLRTTRYWEAEEDHVVTLESAKGEEILSPVQRVQRLRYGNSVNEQIRRLFHRLVKTKNKDRKLKGLKKLTAREIAGKLPGTANQKESVRKLTALYEEARYQAKPMDKEKGAQARELFKRSVE